MKQTKALIPGMKILLVDTCGAVGTVALAEATEILASATLPGRTASERLVPTIRDLVAQADLALPQLDAIAVVHGPGSFTGVRVGLSAAKGLCHALNLPLIAISRLAVLAHLAQRVPHSSHPDRDGWGQICALLDAGRGEFYCGLYLDQSCLRESLLTRDQLLALFSLEPASVPAPMVVACEPTVAESLASLSPCLLSEPTATDALPLALRRIHEQDFDDIVTLDANYLRRTDAEIFAKPRPPKANPAAPVAAPETPAR